MVVWSRVGSANGDEEAVETFLATRWAPLVKAARLLGASAEDAQDLAQETCIRALAAWRKVGPLDDDARSAYVHRILVNVFLKSRRRRWHGEIPTPGAGDGVAVGALTDGVDQREALHRSLMRLPVQQRTVVVLRHFVGLSEKETAAALSVSAGTVKSRLSRALSTLSADTSLLHLETTND